MINLPAYGLLLLLLAGASFTGKAQHFATRMYSASNGLPDVNITSLYQDSKGYLWLGTRTSLCRYDGHRFVNYGKDLGYGVFTGGVVLEDSSHRYWVSTREGVGILRGKEVQRFPLSDGLRIDWLFSMTQLKDGRIWMLTDKGMYEFRDTVWEKKNLVEAYRDRPCRFAVEAPGGIYLSYGHQLFLLDTAGKLRPLTPRNPGSPYYVWLKKYNGQVYVNTVEGIYKIVADTLQRLFKKQIHGTYSFDFMVDTKKRMWISTEAEGLLVSDPGNEEELPHRVSLPFNQTLLLTEDREGNTWAANYEGLLKVTDAALRKFDKTKSPLLENIRHLAIKPDGSLLLYSFLNGFARFTGHQFETDAELYGTRSVLRSQVVDASAYDARGALWLVTRDGRLFRYKNGSVVDYTPKAAGEAFRYVTADPSGKDVYACGRRIYQVRGDTLWPLPTSGHPGLADPRRIYRHGGYTIVYTRDSGVFRIDAPGVVDRLEQIPASDHFHNDFQLFPDPDGSFWTTSFSGGLYKWGWDRTGRLVSAGQVAAAQGLPNQFVIDASFDRQGRMWVATLSGLAVIEKGQRGYTVNPVDDDALSSINNWAEAQMVTDSSGAVWLSSFHETFRFESDAMRFDQAPPPVAISQVLLNLQPQDWSRWTDSLWGPQQLPLFATLPHNRNTISISFDAITFSNNGGVLFSYRLDGLDTSWQSPTGTRSVSFASLSPGTYTFRVRARKPNTAWSNEARISFVIRQPFWATAWFRIALLTAAALTIFLLVRIRIRRIEREARIRQQLQDLDLKAARAANALMAARQKMADAEMQALRAQMNPHFIYNALNSIQSLVLDGRQGEAIRYIGKFARLLRQILEQSDNHLITLDKELSTLELYIQLETLRLHAPLKYQVEVDEQLMPEKELLPPLIIQPYVENALWHGLSRKNGERRLQVQVRATDDWLLIHIRDNGIGRQLAATHKETREPAVESKGMSITAGRLGVLNGQWDGGVQVTDLFDEGNNPAGTEVTLRIKRNSKA